MISQAVFFLSSILFILSSSTAAAAASIGVCYGQVANNLLPPSEVVNLIKSNGISKVRLFNAEPSILQALSGTGVELMIGVPNEILPTLASGGPDAANGWLQNNLFAHVSPDQIRYLAVGNEIFFKDTFYSPFIVPALTNFHQALQTLNLAEKIKLSSPHAASVLLSAFPPSSGAFDPYILPEMHPLLQFLAETGAPLMVNVYPFFSYINNPKDIPLNYALFKSEPTVQDYGLVYDNLFDATIDAFVSALEKEGFPGIPVAVTETGWPTSGGESAQLHEQHSYSVILEIRDKGANPGWSPLIPVERSNPALLLSTVLLENCNLSRKNNANPPSTAWSFLFNFQSIKNSRFTKLQILYNLKVGQGSSLNHLCQYFSVCCIQSLVAGLPVELSFRKIPS